MIKIFIPTLLLTLFNCSHCEHVGIISCAENTTCLANVDRETLDVIKRNMYNATDPCEDFWDYACGSWTAQPYYDHEDTFGALTNNYAKQILKVLKELQASGNDEANSMMIQQIWQYYQTCRSAGHYYLEISKYLKELPLDLVFGKNFQWNWMSNKNSAYWNSFNWLQTLSALRKYGFNGVFLEESMAFATNDSLLYVVEMKIPRPGRQFENKFEILEIFEEFQLTNEQNSPNLWPLVEEIYEFDKELEKLYKKYERSRSKSNIMNLEDLIAKTSSSVDWQLYFASLASDRDAKKNLQMPLEIYEHMNEYFHDLHMMLSAKHNSLVAWYFMLSFCKYLDTIKPLITERDCLLHTSVMFPLGVNYIYNRYLYKTRQEDELILENILKKLKQHFHLYFEHNKLDLLQQELQYLKDKLSAVQLQIGNFPRQLPPLNDYYSSAHLSESNFFFNHLEMLKFRFHQQHQPLWAEHSFPLDLQSYYVNDDISSLRNAPYFIHPRNLLVVPELFLQLPFFNHRQHSLFHYSLVGWIMAHELSHSFDSYGLGYDSHGNLNPLGLQISLNPSFSAAMKCLSCQNPCTDALNERVADVNGLQLVWDVYWQNFLDQPNLNLDFSVQQMFLLNFAQFFCGSLPQAVAHDRDDIRVRVSVGNLREFSQVFQCSNGAEDSDALKCDVWRK